MIMCLHSCASCSFFQDGLKAVDNLKPSIEKLATDLHTVRKPVFFVLFFLTLTFPSRMHHLNYSFVTDKAGAG